jgi:hypothetical protein
MPKRFCIGCLQLYDRDTTNTQRCPRCQPAATAARNARPGSSSRGLGWAHSQRKQADAGYQAATRCQCTGCPWCGSGCGQPFTSKNPKTAGHTIPRKRGGGGSPILAICRACNSADGGRLGHQP